MRHGVTSVSFSTHTGTVRARNEDRFLVRSDLGLWVVADGAGGHSGGDVAATRIASDLDGIEPGAAALEPDHVAAVVEGTHRALLDQARASGVDAMASTVAILILNGSEIACLWAGDSRIYRYRHARLEQLTEDHSLVQELVKTGEITPQEAERHPRRHVITRAVGAPAGAFALEKSHAAPEPGDLYLLCSDGLCKALDDDEIAAILAQPLGGHMADALMEAALARHASDNVTAIVVAIESSQPAGITS